MLEGPAGFWGQWASGRWRPETHRRLRQLLTPETTLLDVGAWVGPVALWAAPLCRQVVAIEPDPVAFESLVRNTSEWANVACYNVALSPSGGVTQLYHRGAFGDSMSSLVPTGEDAVTVSTFTPAALLDIADDPVVANMNIEGSEALVLPVMAPLLIERKIPLLLSVHERWSGPGGPERIADAVSLFGDSEVIGEDGPGFYELLLTP